MKLREQIDDNTLPMMQHPMAGGVGAGGAAGPGGTPGSANVLGAVQMPVIPPAVPVYGPPGAAAPDSGAGS